MSAPAAKARLLPVSTIAEMLVSASRVRRQAFRSLIKGVKSAFRALGLLRVTVLWNCVSGFARMIGRRKGVSYSKRHQVGEC